MSDNAAEHDDTANQGPGIPDSQLPPSEPPDIKNWFSSYEYESFVLETNDNFEFSDYEESQGYENERRTENIAIKSENSKAFTRSCENDDMMKKKTSSILSQYNQSGEDNKCLNQILDSRDSPLLYSELPGIDNWFCSYAYESPPPDTINHLILSPHKQTMVHKEEPCNEKKKEVEKDKNMICNQRVEECDNASTKDENGNQSVCTDIESNENAEIHEANGDSWERTGSGKNEKVEKGVGNGFVSVKSKREEDEKSRRGTGSVKRPFSSCVVVGKNKMKEDGREKSRKTFGDITNLQPGKWKCPQKRKPDIGPPLKQLQLGQWFHRQ